MPLSILLDTDIGTDIDDAYALVLAAVSPELDLRAVTTVNNDTTARAKIAVALLRLLGREDVPVFAGESLSLTAGETRGWMGHEGRGLDLADIDESSVLRDAPAAIARLAREADQDGSPLTVITIGAMTDLAVALERHPGDTARIAQVIAMASDYRGFGEENARPEHNVACDPVAAQRVLSSGLPVTLVGLNVTQRTAMSSADVDALASVGGPLAHALCGMHRVWFDCIRSSSSPMHDGLAVAAAVRPDVVTLETVGARVLYGEEPAGRIVFNRSAPGEVTKHAVAVDLDAAGFRRLFRERVHRAAEAARGSL